MLVYIPFPQPLPLCEAIQCGTIKNSRINAHPGMQGAIWLSQTTARILLRGELYLKHTKRIGVKILLLKCISLTYKGKKKLESLDVIL